MAHEQIYEWLDSLDLYIQPSQVEGLSRALVEAMSRALPAFASDVGGNPELLEPGCIHKCGSVKDITEELENLTAGQMMTMAKYNYQKAGNFQKAVLQKNVGRSCGPLQKRRKHMFCGETGKMFGKELVRDGESKPSFFTGCRLRP